MHANTHIRKLLTHLSPFQDLYNNPFGDFNNQLISDVAMGKSTEITDLVMQQQQQPEFCNLTDTMTNNLNSINNNKISNGGHAEDFGMMLQDEEPMSEEQQSQNLDAPSPVDEQNVASGAAAVDPNDDNNNSNDNFGPETDVDAIDEEFQFHAVEGDKEKVQMEFKETADEADRIEQQLCFSAGEFIDQTAGAVAGAFGSLENKIFEEMSLHNPDLMMGSNPFADESNNFMDNKLMEENVMQSQQEALLFGNQSAEPIDDDFAKVQEQEQQEEVQAGEEIFEKELLSANDAEEIAMEQQQHQQQQQQQEQQIESQSGESSKITISFMSLSQCLDVLMISNTRRLNGN